MTVRMETQRTRLNMLPALSFVPDRLAPPKGCWPTTAPVGDYGLDHKTANTTDGFEFLGLLKEYPECLRIAIVSQDLEAEVPQIRQQSLSE